MKTKTLLALALTAITLLVIITPLAGADTLLAADFQQESFQKTVDFYEYARAHATLRGMPEPPANNHAWVYMTYINTTGLKLLYAGLDNVTHDGGLTSFTIPMQTFIMHYKTNNRTRDVIMGSTFLMLMAFNDTTTSLYPDSPDMNDELYASFSFGFDLSALNNTLPVFNTKTTIIPLTNSSDGLTWTWGMKYTNLTALWWPTLITPNNPHVTSLWPIALTLYDELTFTYSLTIDPSTGTATLTENHVIGRMRELIFGILPILWVRYNATGAYGMDGQPLPPPFNPNYTIHDFARDNHIKMSIVNFQSSVLLDHETYSMTGTGANATDTETDVSTGGITTYADDGEKIYDATFGTKQDYKLYNYTADPTETQYDTYEAKTRTARIMGYAGNAGLFTYHMALLKFLPLLVYNMYPGMFNRALQTIGNMSRTNYFYVISYPTYGGYRVEHDPTYTVYLMTETPGLGGNDPAKYGFVILIAIVVAVVVAVAVIARRRKHSQPSTPQTPTS
jgi:hypothetical protein